MSSQQVTAQTRWKNSGARKEQSLDSFIRIIKAMSIRPMTIRQLCASTGLCDKTIRRYIKVLSCHFIVQEFGEEHNKHDPPKYFIPYY